MADYATLLGALPKAVARKARRILRAMDDGTPYTALHGKRLAAMGQRHIISIPLGRRWRLICNATATGIHPIEAISHETYNNRLSSGGWTT